MACFVEYDIRNSPFAVAGSGMSANAHQVRAQSQFFSSEAKTFFRTTDLDTKGPICLTSVFESGERPKACRNRAIEVFFQFSHKY